MLAFSLITSFSETWSRPRPREYRPRDRGYSPSMEPSPKRIRHDYYGGEGYYNHYAPYHQAAHRYVYINYLIFILFIYLPVISFSFSYFG